VHILRHRSGREELTISRYQFTPQPEGHTREGVDEWPSGGIPLHGGDRDPALKDAMAVRPWSFTRPGILIDAGPCFILLRRKPRALARRASFIKYVDITSSLCQNIHVEHEIRSL
jgi:hypothetical protein